MRFTEEQGKQYQSIIDFLSPPDGTPTSTAKLAKELEWDSADVREAAGDLIAFGELELVNTSQAARVRLRQPIPATKAQASFADLTENVWLAYIIEQGVGRTRARRLYSEQEAAEEHLKQIAGVDTLIPVPGITGVWCASIGIEGYSPEYVVLRKEPVFQQANDPYSESR